jgi:hypothetical protein
LSNSWSGRVCTKHDLYDIITEFRRKNPRSTIPETAFHETALSSPRPRGTRLGRIIEMGQRLPKDTTH